MALPGAIARLEVPERLTAGPLPVAELAAAVGADEDALWRVLRLVADHQTVTFEGDRVCLTDRGRLLCRDHPASLQAAFATVGSPDIARGLTQTLQTGRVAAPGVQGILVDQPHTCSSMQDPSWNAKGWPTAVCCTRGPVRPSPPADLYVLTSVLHGPDDTTRPASWRRWPGAPPGTAACGSSRCRCPPTPPPTGPR